MLFRSFLFTVSVITVMFGAMMYAIEGGSNPDFDNIPRSVYWCIVTVTTVGYGDIAPVTPLGQAVSSMLMLLGYSIIAIPTGIVTSELIKQNSAAPSRVCGRCGQEGHGKDAAYCAWCGAPLENGQKRRNA